MQRMTRRIAYVTTVAALALVAFAAPASAQQLINAGGENGYPGGAEAFVGLVIMVYVIATALFFLDRIRRRRERDQ